MPQHHAQRLSRHTTAVRFAVAILTVVTFGVAACGTATTTGTGGLYGTSSTATTTGTAATATTGTSDASNSALPPPPGARVTVSVGSTRYSTTQAISVTVHNGLSSPITTEDHRTSCTIVLLERQAADGTWQEVGRCLIMTPTRMITLAAGEQRVQTLTPTSGGMNPASGDSQWLPGTYRVSFNFTIGTSAARASTPAPVYSGTFTVA